MKNDREAAEGNNYISLGTGRLWVVILVRSLDRSIDRSIVVTQSLRNSAHALQCSH